MGRDFIRRLDTGGLSDSDGKPFWQQLYLDWPLLLLLLLLCAGGLVVFYSASGQDQAALNSQTYKLLLAMTVMMVLARINPVFYMKLAPFVYLVSIFLLVAVLALGSHVNGSRRWLELPLVGSFQPSELIKLVLPLLLARFFRDRQMPPTFVDVFVAGLLIVVPALLVASQPDLGTAILIGLSGVLVLWLTGIGWRYLFGVMILGCVSVPLCWPVLREYQRERFWTMIYPEQDPFGSGWNILQSMTAIGSGGVFGKGLLQGSQTYLEYLPERRTDFILAVLAEETGLVGVLALSVLYFLIVLRCAFIAMQTQDAFGRLLVGGLTFTFYAYVFVNIAMVSGLLPVVGVPLPLISHGGTSIVTLLVGFGLIMSIHAHRQIGR